MDDPVRSIRSLLRLVAVSKPAQGRIRGKTTPSIPRLLSILAVPILLVSASGASHAQPTIVPSGLIPGDEYRLVFVTSTVRDANSTNIDDYNSFVAGVANSVPELAALGTTWTAIGSTSGVDARDNTSTHPGVDLDAPIYRLDGSLVATSNADLWDGSIHASLNIYESGGTGVSEAWTGTDTDGTGSSNAQLGTLTAVKLGLGTLTNAGWVAATSVPPLSDQHIRAISGVLSVPGDPIAVPSGLTPGTPYRLVFMTSRRLTALSTDIADYNSFVTDVANTVPELVALGTTWTAIGSSSVVDARDNTATVPSVAPDLPMYQLNDTLVANDNADLWDGTIAVPLNVTETGAAREDYVDQVWTGTELPGVAVPDHYLGTAGVQYGVSWPATGADWISVDSEWLLVPKRLYGISGVLVAPGVSAVPSLSGGSLLVLSGTMVLLGIRRFNRRTR